VSGRKPIPTHLKILRGNPGKRPLNKSEPKPTGKLPACPEWLSEHARELWNRFGPELEKLGVATDMDAVAMELLCDTYGEWRMAKERGDWCAAVSAWKRLKAILIEFGLTPSSRTKVSKVAGDEKDPFEEHLRAGSQLGPGKKKAPR
jgi:phage terminase small subunit